MEGKNLFRWWGMLLILLSYLPLYAQSDTLRVLGGQGNPGTTDNVVTIELTNTVEVAGIQFNLEDIPDFLKLKAVRKTDRTTNLDLIGNDIQTYAMVVVLSFYGDKLPPGRGPVLEMLYDVDSTANAPQVALTFSNVTVSDPSLQAINVFLDNGQFIIPNPVPVELAAFSGTAIETRVELTWATASETNNYGFQVERRNENSSFTLIGFVEGHGTISTPQTYQFTDYNLEPETYFYRLKQMDLDGSFQFSREIEVTVELPESYLLEQNYPNPFSLVGSHLSGVTSGTRIKYQLAQSGRVSLKVFNLLGQEVRTLQDPRHVGAGIHTVIWDGKNNSGESVPAGVYLYRIFVEPGNGQGKGFTSTRKMILMN